MKKDRHYLPILIFTTLALGMVLGTLLNIPIDRESVTANNHKNKLNRLIDFIETEYVDDVNTDSIVDLTVNNILDKLDPHSVYIAKNEMEEVSQSMKGDFVGIGVNFYMYNDTVSIIKPMPDGPSAKAGIIAGDRILYAGKDKLFGRKLSTEDLFSKLKGEAGSEVKLTIYRKSEKRRFEVNVKRDVVPIKSVDVALMIDKSTGYIKINRFAETTYDEFHKGLMQLKKAGAKNMIVDVRDNGGGYLEKAVEIADEFLSKGRLIVFTKSKKGKVEKTFASTKGDFESGNLYVLVNENSASASEIFAGAIQDNDRGTIVGRRTFGKGLVQREMGFDDGSAVRLTVARYYTPTGRSIQKSYKKGKDEYYKDFDRRFESGELYKKDSIKIADTLKFKTPKGKIVYGGGGIVPDVFVPLETEHGDESLGYMMQSGVVGYFVFEQLEKNRSQFKGMSYEGFLKYMNGSDVYYANFQKYLVDNGVNVRLDHAKELVKRYIVAEFAQQLFGEQKYFEITLAHDAMIKSILNKPATS
ncbi:MAG: peptidase S41 [Flavobacterium sp. BFFFF1]|uniref:S41 family peptidase n=1 Tax=Flavobacterium sp. BFFFF1 TaxID=2015557 RepID=UPI000BC96217|nr:S41 family peptidase [Flavobacterium sp. BFFFF1]OYU81454.1 MAG: peptidase S41 [Flavobacterium sp. BFFFF1]